MIICSTKLIYYDLFKYNLHAWYLSVFLPTITNITTVNIFINPCLLCFISDYFLEEALLR